ncbi:uncharacterized protein PG998_012454 [Apiospora kogelbergensis]|uniref:Secreted protein n=1 Tax=Apiospora kogelbergensis TaxID=1337665 RepID=A0AAW0QMZ7_9PEZI
MGFSLLPLSFVWCLGMVLLVHPEPMHSNGSTDYGQAVCLDKTISAHARTHRTHLHTKHSHPPIHADSHPRELLSQNNFCWEACSFAILDAESAASHMTATRLPVSRDRRNMTSSTWVDKRSNRCDPRARQIIVLMIPSRA